jgi:hypothetical protein
LKKLNRDLEEGRDSKTNKFGNRLNEIIVHEAYLDCCLVEISGDIAYHPSLVVSDWYFDYVNPKECEKHDALIYHIYSELKGQEAKIHDIIGKLTRFPPIAVPPITAIAMKRCKARTNFWNVLLEIRD